jgi:ADP-ribosylglycohydrolase
MNGQEPSNRSRILGCLLGGAVGDALGAPIEFMSADQIQAEFGPSGLTDFAPAYGRKGAITDDTQMTMFTAEALIRGWVRFSSKGIASAEYVAWKAYRRWLLTQGIEAEGENFGRDGWLFGVKDLWNSRAPGSSCISALRGPRMGETMRPINNSKGCGAVMRMAPVGLFFSPAMAFRHGCNLGALTHGHPTGFLAAGFFASLISDLLAGRTIDEGLGSAQGLLKTHDRHEETLNAIEKATTLAREQGPSAEVSQLGEGWVAEEALAIGLFCALTASDFDDGITRAANHGGDSDSTASIAGNILGTCMGVEAVSNHWLDQLELRTEIEQLAVDLWEVSQGKSDAEKLWERYPGW